MDKKINRVIIVIFLISLMFRLGFGIYIYKTQGTSNFCDDWVYINYAKTIQMYGIGTTNLNNFKMRSTGVGPGYPIILASLFKIFGKNYLSGIILNAILSSLIPLIIFFIAKKVYNSKVGLYSFIWSSIYILHYKFIPRLIKAELVFILFPFVIYLIIKEFNRSKISYTSFIAPFIFTYLIHVDERYFFYFPFLVISFLFLQRGNFKIRLKKSFVFMSVVIILMIPWSIRNYKAYNRIVILTERTNRFTDKLFGYEKEKSNNSGNIYTNLKLRKSTVDSLIAGYKIKHIKDFTKMNIRAGIENGKYPHSFNTVEKWISNLRDFWEPIRLWGYYSASGYLYRGPWSLKHNISEGITLGLLLPFFLIGIYLTIKSKNKYGIFLIIIIILHTFLHVVLTFVVQRYRYPIDSFVIIIAFYGIQQCYYFLFLSKNSTKFFRNGTK